MWSKTPNFISAAPGFATQLLSQFIQSHKSVPLEALCRPHRLQFTCGGLRGHRRQFGRPRYSGCMIFAQQQMRALRDVPLVRLARSPTR
jgi:hypothetical protein